MMIMIIIDKDEIKRSENDDLHFITKERKKENVNLIIYIKKSVFTFLFVLDFCSAVTSEGFLLSACYSYDISTITTYVLCCVVTSSSGVSMSIVA